MTQKSSTANQEEQEDEVDELPTATYNGECPETGDEIKVEKLCPEGWKITNLSVYTIGWERNVDGLTAYHSVDEFKHGHNTENKLAVDGETKLKGEVSKRDAIKYLMNLPSPKTATDGGNKNPETKERQ